MSAAGRTLAPAMLFFGCRTPGAEDLYREEFDRWEKMGAVTVRRAYSRQKGESEGCKYVQDRLWRERGEVADLWTRGARVYVCGSREVGKAVEEAFVKVLVEEGVEEVNGLDGEGARKWFEGMRNVRYAVDVFD